MRDLQTEIPLLSHEDARNISRKRLLDVQDTRIEVISYLQQANLCVNRAREVLEEALIGNEDYASGLEGEVDEFVAPFEPQIDACEALFEQCEAKLQQQIDLADKEVEVMISRMQEGCETIQSNLEIVLNVEPADFFFDLEKLPNFGQQLNEGEWDFEWPTTSDLEELGIEEPLRLTEVRTRGYDGMFATAI